MIIIKILNMVDNKYIGDWVQANDNGENTAIIKNINDFYTNASFLIDEMIDGNLVKVVKLDETKKAELISMQEQLISKQNELDELKHDIEGSILWGSTRTSWGKSPYMQFGTIELAKQHAKQLESELKQLKSEV